MSALPLRICGLAGVLLMSMTACSPGQRPLPPEENVYEIEGERFFVQVVARDLVVPWALAWPGDGRILVTQRPGQLSAIDPDTGRVSLIANVPHVDAVGEGGLMSVAVSPQFAQDRFIYLSYVAKLDGRSRNRIVRFTLDDGGLKESKVLVDDIPAHDYHDGLPLKFGADGKLYASTGDAGQRAKAQDNASLLGKFLRINADGSIPADNPFPGSPIWSLGHRNCQGFDWQQASGVLIAAEHGPSLGAEPWSGGDELNWVRPGMNYGWPTYRNEIFAKKEGFMDPLKVWGDPAIAPAGAAFYSGDKFPQWKGKFFFAALRGEALLCATLDIKMQSEGKDRMPADVKVVRVSEGLKGVFGRLRAVAQGPDGYLYLTTSNRDKRGSKHVGDDLVLRLVPVGETAGRPDTGRPDTGRPGTGGP